jgi:hypothetical protein
MDQPPVPEEYLITEKPRPRKEEGDPTEGVVIKGKRACKIS